MKAHLPKIKVIVATVLILSIIFQSPAIAIEPTSYTETEQADTVKLAQPTPDGLAPAGLPNPFKWTWGKVKETSCKAIFGDDDCRISIPISLSDILEGLILSLLSWLGGEALVNPQGSLDSASGNAGAIGVMSYAVGTVVANPPTINTKDYIKDTLANNLLNPRAAYAQTGSQTFQPVKEVWSKVRDLTLGLYLIMIVIAGFMIMFGYKLDPRTRVTVISTLPSIVISLILIVFSFVISGLLLDFGVLAVGLIHNFFSSALIPVTGRVTDINPWTLYKDIIWGIRGLRITGFGGSNAFTGGILLVIWTVGLFISFRIFFILIFRYAQLYIQVILAPLFFMWGSLPGQREHMARWFRGVIVNVMVFPTIFFLVNVAFYISQIGATDTLIGLPPGVGDLGSDISKLVAFGILIAIPKVPELLEDAVKAETSPAVGRAITEASQVARRAPIIGGLMK